ncbi:MAG: hypothetical protein COA36_10040 [Desulfotalea sp.]|nr:MAG: hypothetical protein COA36_10040 [Desulfotalea sp.]
MTTTLPCNQVTIGWNGIRLAVPAHWETIVSGPSHLIFEDDFNPVFQIRWKKIGPLSPQKWQEKCDLWWQQLGVAASTVKLPSELNKLTDKFSHTRYYQGKQAMESGGICYCDHCETLFFFQQLSADSNLWKMTEDLLCQLSCHGATDTLWQIQDFSLTTPGQYSLTGYTFKTGLTRLSFSAANYDLHICRLAQASNRLSTQSLEDIHLGLAGTKDLQLDENKNKTLSCGTRAPSLTRQLLLRLRREKPFIESRLWLLEDSDRLLACIAYSKRPIPTNDLNLCYETFKIV